MDRRSPDGRRCAGRPLYGRGIGLVGKPYGSWNAGLQTDWDDFPYLFFHNTHNIYLVGLDPTYLERADPELWDLWVAVTQGEIHQPSAAIRSAFGATYVVSDAQHKAFTDKARDDPGMHLVYQDEYSYVWQIAP